MDNEKAERACTEALAKVRLKLSRIMPYFSSTLYGLIPVFVPGLKTLGVTKNLVMLVDPEWFVSIPFEQQVGCILHECNHVIRGMQRIEQLPDKELANIAFDLPINDDIEAMQDKSIQLPSWVHYSKKFGFPAGKTGEQYYEMLLRKSGGKGGLGLGEAKIGAGKCGSCAGGALDQELEDKANGEYGRDEADVHRIRVNTLEAIQGAAKNGVCRGINPAFAKELLDTLKEPPLVPWRQTFSRIWRRAKGRIVAGRSDFSLARPSKRSIVRGIIRPGLVDRKLQILLVEDSSGSMGPEQLKQVRIECAGIMSQTGVDYAWFIDADADVAMKPKLVSLRDIYTLPVHGRGGTDFRPAIELASKMKPRPDIVVYLTDGDGPAPDHPPKGFEVIWCIVPSSWSRRPAPWGHLVVCSDDKKLREPYGT